MGWGRRGRRKGLGAALGLLLALAAGATWVGAAGTAAGQQAAGGTEAAPYRVYIATFRGCEEVCEAFKAYLTGRGLAVDFIERSIERDVSRIPGLVEEVRTLRPDLLVTWGTAISLGMVGRHDAEDRSAYITDIPTVYLYVSEPVRAGLVAGDEVSGRANVAGANIGVPLDAQLRVMQSYRDVSRLGVVYGANEANSVAAVAALRDAAAEMGVEVVEEQLALGADGTPDPQSIAPAMQALAAQRPAFLVTVSSTFIIQNIEAYTAAAVEAGLPVFTSAELPIRQGRAMLALFASLSSIGQVSGYQAEQILRDGADPASLPTPSLRRFTLLINMPVALELRSYPPMLVLQFAELMG